MSDKYLSGIDLTTGKMTSAVSGDVIVCAEGLSIAGATGLAGVSMRGATGLRGIQGETGTVGVTGLQAPTGLRGFTGLRGATGVQGLTGIIGPTGLRGLTGSVVGATGIRGVTGSQGYFNYTYTDADISIDATMEYIAIDGTSSNVLKNLVLTLPVRAGIAVGKRYIFFNEGVTYTVPPIPQSTAAIVTQGGDTLNGTGGYTMILSSKETVFVYNNGVEYAASFFKRGATGLLVGETGILGVTGVTGTTGIQGMTGV